MKRIEMKRGDRYMYHDYPRDPRPVVLLDTKPTKTRPDMKKACNVSVRFLDDDTEGVVGTRGIRRMSILDIKAPPPAPAPALRSGVNLCFTVEFRVPAEQAGVIESVLELLRGQGTADVVGVQATTG